MIALHSCEKILAFKYDGITYDQVAEYLLAARTLPASVVHLVLGREIVDGREEIGTLNKSWFVLSSHYQANK